MAEKDRKVLGKGIGAIFERDDKDISKLLDDIQMVRNKFLVIKQPRSIFQRFVQTHTNHEKSLMKKH